MTPLKQARVADTLDSIIALSPHERQNLSSLVWTSLFAKIPGLRKKAAAIIGRAYGSLIHSAFEENNKVYALVRQGGYLLPAFVGDAGPIVSPHGQRVIYDSDDNGLAGACQKNNDGPGDMPLSNHSYCQMLAPDHR